MTTIGQVTAAVYRNIQMLLSSKLNDLDIKVGQYDFFYVISFREGISQKQLSQHLHISKSTTAKAVKNLVNKGYIRKEKDETDNRLDRLYLTDLGKRTAPVVAEIFGENLSVATEGLTDKEIDQVTILMNKILNNVVKKNEELNKEGGDHE